MTDQPTLDLSTPIIFFDGDCVMCNGFVDWILKIDQESIFRLSPLQGQTATQLLPSLPRERESWSMFYLDGTQLYSQSDAALQVLKRLGGFWSILSLIRGVPRFCRDPIYRMIARHRYRLCGRRSTCRIPTEQEQDHFLP